MAQKMMENRKAQVAVWVILAVFIVGAVVLYFAVSGGKKILPVFQESVDPQPYIARCVRQAANGALDRMLPQGGFVEPAPHVAYQGRNVTYVCMTASRYEPCVMQHPMYAEEVRAELQKVIEPEIEECFLTLKEELERRDANVELGGQRVHVELIPQRVQIAVERKMSVDEKGAGKRYERFDTALAHPVYDLALVATEIANQEATYCSFEYVGYMMLYPAFDIRKVALSDGTKVYTIKDSSSSQALTIATRGCVIPPGI